MNTLDDKYKDLVRYILDNGVHSVDRTGVGTLSVFGYQIRHNLAEGFPLLTTKKIHTKSVIHELLWFLRGSTNARELEKVGVTIWSDWCDEHGNLGPIYGHGWRRWGENVWEEVDGIDQIAQLVEGLKNNPYSRRHLVSAWNVSDLPNMALPPCHYSFQCYVRDNKLSLLWNQRSVDVGLGLPFNIASYAILCHMLAQVCGYEPGEVIFSGGDVHIYTNHIDALKGQLEREPYDLPVLKLNPEVQDIDGFKYEDVTIENYQSHTTIKMPIAV